MAKRTRKASLRRATSTRSTPPVSDPEQLREPRENDFRPPPPLAGIEDPVAVFKSRILGNKQIAEDRELITFTNGEDTIHACLPYAIDGLARIPKPEDLEQAWAETEQERSPIASFESTNNTSALHRDAQKEQEAANRRLLQIRALKERGLLNG